MKVGFREFVPWGAGGGGEGACDLFQRREVKGKETDLFWNILVKLPKASNY